MLNIKIAYAFKTRDNFLEDFQELAKYFTMVHFVAFYIGKDIKTLYKILSKWDLDRYKNVEFLIPDKKSYKDQEVVAFYDEQLVFRGKTIGDILKIIHKITDDNEIGDQLIQEINEKIEIADTSEREFLLYAQDIGKMYRDIAKILSSDALKKFIIAIKKLHNKVENIYNKNT